MVLEQYEEQIASSTTLTRVAISIFQDGNLVNITFGVYIYIYIYNTEFNPVNPKLGTIRSRTIKMFKNRISNLGNPG